MKKFLSLCLVLALTLTCAVPVFASSEEPSAAAVEDLYVPAAYLDENGAMTDAVVNGYYAETAPILLLTDDSLVDTALANGYVAVVTDAADMADTAAALQANDADQPGDAELLVAVGSGEDAAVIAQLSLEDAGLYAAVLYDPAAAGQCDGEALAEGYSAALTAYLLENYQSSRQDGPNIVYTIDTEGAQAYVAENAAYAEVDYDTLDAVIAADAIEASDTVLTTELAVGDTAAPYYYIRGNSDDSVCASAALALGDELRAAGATVNCAVSWGSEDSSALFDWLERVCKYEVQYTPDEVETVLNLANAIAGGEYTWKAGSDAYTISYVTAVANPELEDYEGLSIAIPAAYIEGIDEDGNLIIDWDAEITTPNGATYTAATAPIIVNTGAAGYSSSTTSGAGGNTYAAYGYINVACGNRGKNNVCTDAEGNSYYTGDAPYCLVDQKAVVRYLKYNIGLGNLCGDADRIVSTGGSGGGAHSLMLAATGNHPDFYPYLEESGAVGAYYDEASDSYYATISDAIWGCCPYSPITNLQEADLAYEWESLFSDTGLDYIEASDFKRALSELVADAYVEYVNGLGLEYDLDGDGSAEPMTINADGVSGSYVDFLVAQAESDLEWFLDNIDCVDLNVTWQNENGESKAEAYFYGHYDYTQSIDGLELSGYDLSSFGMVLSGSEEEGWQVEMDAEGFMSYRSRSKGVTSFDRLGFLDENGDYNAENLEFGNETQDYRHWDEMLLAVLEDNADTLSALYTPDDTYGLYETYDDMLEAYREDVAIITAGDEYSAYTDDTIVELYNPLRYILDEQTEQPFFARLVHGTQDKDVSLMTTQNDYIAWTMMGVNTYLYWGWDNVHVADDPLNTSKTSFIDAMAIYEDTGVLPESITAAAETASSASASGEASSASGEAS